MKMYFFRARLCYIEKSNVYVQHKGRAGDIEMKVNGESRHVFLNTIRNGRLNRSAYYFNVFCQTGVVSMVVNRLPQTFL